MEFRIGSINARGLGDRTKRREFFNWLRRKQFSISFIQEAHRTENNMHDWRAEWGAKLFSVAVLVKKQVLSYCLTTTLLFIFREHIVIPGDAL